MTLYYSLCFGLLMCELTLFCTIICPMPFSMRKKMFHFLSENPVVAKIQYGLKITFIFVAVLFIDALQRMVRIAQEGVLPNAWIPLAFYLTNPRRIIELPGRLQKVAGSFPNSAARKFYAQRNLYLTGATLFLSLILSRVFYIILDFINVQENFSALQQRTARNSSATGESAELRKRITELEGELKTSQAEGRDFDNLKKQANQQNAEYNRLADEHAKALIRKQTGAVSDKKAD